MHSLVIMQKPVRLTWASCIASGRRSRRSLIEDVPFLPVPLQEIDLRSMESASMVLQSSGTTGQRPPCFVDLTATLQSTRSSREASNLLATAHPMLMLDTKRCLMPET
jgi:hypothetical protein